ncbi:hypothetical protein [Luteibacter sp. CQ10]|uniref:hypothetical protein n=1 Tax=Luteibacter sp. CQ10 TaxID=2805821 RepID=UPI0034A52A43
MSDTVDLLEALGRDSTLRNASPEELVKALEAAGASAGLREFAASGNATALTEELGIEQVHVEHMSLTGGCEGDEDDPHHHPDDGDDEGDASDDRSDDPST